MNTNIKTLQRRLEHLQNRTHRNTFDEAEMSALREAIEALYIIHADSELSAQLRRQVDAQKELEK